MRRNRVSCFALALVAGVLGGCGSSGMGGADAGSDASRSFCEGVADGTPCGDATETAFRGSFEAGWCF